MEVNREDKRACGIDKSMVKYREDGGERYERLTRIAKDKNKGKKEKEEDYTRNGLSKN